jgi:hypothetical protein
MRWRAISARPYFSAIDKLTHSAMRPEEKMMLYEILGRGLHSATFQLNLSTTCGLHQSTFRLDVSTFLDVVEASIDKTRHRLS